jgi:hypothetical protein
VHQLAEYALAVALVASSVHVSNGTLLLWAGVAFGLLATTAPGPLVVRPLCPPKLHAVLDVVVALCLALAPILPSLRPDVSGILLAEFAAVGWLRLATLTDFSRRARRRRPAPKGGPIP